MNALSLKEAGRLALRMPDREGQAEIIELLQEKIDNEHEGSRQDFADSYGISYKVICSTLNRFSRPHYQILNHFGFKKTISYRSTT